MTLPLLPLKKLVVFPKMTVSFDAVRRTSVRTIESAMDSENKRIFLVAQSDPEKEYPSEADLFKVGVVAKINQLSRLPGGIVRVTVEGLYRASLCKLINDDPEYIAEVEETEEINTDNLIVNEGFIRSLGKTFDEYFALEKNIPFKDFIDTDGNVDPGAFADLVAANAELNYKQKQEILEEADVYIRVEKLIEFMAREIEVLKISRELDKKVKKNIDKNQREYYLREELKVIEEELGEKNGVKGETEAYRASLKKLRMKKDVREKLEKDISRFEKMQSSSPDSAVMRNYLDFVLALPWNKTTKESADIQKAREILDSEHYGLEKVKDRILEYLAVRQLSGDSSTVICLVGPPGTGKTSIAKSVAKSLNRKYVRISLGGIHDEADIRGHRKTYIGAMPGRIISAVSEAGVKNPLILLDEIDKMGSDYKGDPSAALLEVLDWEQNSSFRDHFTEVPFDLSKAIFITTANTLSTIPEPLLDRIEVIEVPGYTALEKNCIAKQFLLPRQMEKNGLSKFKLSVEDKAIEDIIDYYTRESGVRALEREIGTLMRKVAKKLLEEKKKSLRITSKNLTDFLGKHRFNFDNINECDDVGIVRGLAWTSAGGDTLSVEANVMPGDGQTKLTGNLGDVMKESAMTAISFIRTRCKELGIDEEFYKNRDIHIHVPEGAVPKDGPSAGITLATAIASALTGCPVKRNVAMTGEITLRGRVLPIGGLKEKSAAAHRAGIKTLLFPAENKPDLDEIAQEIKDDIKFIPVSGMDEVLKHALVNK